MAMAAYMRVSNHAFNINVGVENDTFHTPKGKK